MHGAPQKAVPQRRAPRTGDRPDFPRRPCFFALAEIFFVFLIITLDKHGLPVVF